MTEAGTFRIDDAMVKQPTPDVMKRASNWLAVMRNDCFCVAGIPWQQPMVTGNLEGQVVFEWWGAARKTLTIRLDENGVEPLRCWFDAGRLEMDEPDVEDRRALWLWLFDDGGL